MSRNDPKGECLAAELQQLEDAGLRRSLRVRSTAQSARVTLDGREVVNFSSNNYLGLADHPALATASSKAATDWGTGAGASRLIVGNGLLHERLEQELAEFHAAESALLFNSGYHANVGVVSGLLGRGDVVFSDELNHASLIDGCRLSRAHVVVYPHADTDRLRALLAQDRLDNPSRRRRLIVSDSVFSMDGDLAPVAELVELAQAEDCWLMLDEAHALGVLGETGAGVAEALGLSDEVDIVVGTLGKAVGSFGGYVVCASAVRQLLLQRARSFVFTTALPAAVVEASRAGLAALRGSAGAEWRGQLRANIDLFRRGLVDMGLLQPGAGQSAVFPVVIGDPVRAMQASEALLELGMYAQGIRPPTVPAGSARLRVALMATHTAADIEDLLSGLAALRARGLV